MDSSKKSDGVYPVTYTNEVKTTDHTADKNKKYIPTNENPVFAGKSHQMRSVSSKIPAPSETKFLESMPTPKNKFSKKCFEFVKNFKANTPNKTKTFLAAALILLVPVVGAVVVCCYLLVNYKITKDEIRESVTPDYSIEPVDDSFEEFHNLFATEALNVSLHDDVAEDKISENKLRSYLLTLFRGIQAEDDDQGIFVINQVVFELTPHLADFLNSRSNNQMAINKSIKTVLSYIEDDELAKLNDFFAELKNNKVLMASLAEDSIALTLVNEAKRLTASS